MDTLVQVTNVRRGDKVTATRLRSAKMESQLTSFRLVFSLSLGMMLVCFCAFLGSPLLLCAEKLESILLCG